MRFLAVVVVSLLLAACRGEERDTAAAVVKETLEAVRPKQQVVIQLRDEDVTLRNTIEDQLVAQRVGTVVERGEGTGFTSLALEVDSTADAVPRVRAILRELELLEKSSVQVRQK
ncbi:MAG TPA: hypothetical protein VEO54_30765 [Thermoanaerobaculia bacterium]|nr:hypothetical protein [Thermoanaerobaculia bacterium]